MQCGGDKAPTYSPTSNITSATFSPTSNITSSTFTPTNNSTLLSTAPDATPQLLCAFSEEELNASCSDAQDCNSGPCPKGMFCFPYDCGTSAKEEPAEVPVEGPAAADEMTFYCGATVEELVLTCSQAKQCSGEAPCPTGEFCFKFDCEQMPDETQVEGPAVTDDAKEPLCPDGYVGWNSMGDCTEYYQCKDGVAGVFYACGVGLKYDKVRKECYYEDLVNSHCYGPALEEGEGEQPPSSEGDSNGTSSAGPASNGLCIEGYTGWEAHNGCREYY